MKYVTSFLIVVTFVLITVLATSCTTAKTKFVTAPATAKVYLISTQRLEPRIDRVEVGETPLQDLVPPAGFDKISERSNLQRFLWVYRNDLYIEINKPGYEVVTLPLTEFLQNRKAADGRDPSSIALAPVIDVNALEQIDSEAALIGRVEKSVDIGSNVVDALIYVNGTLVGSTPSMVHLTPGHYMVEVRHPHCQLSTRDMVQVKANEAETRLNFALPACGEKSKLDKKIVWKDRIHWADEVTPGLGSWVQ